MSHPSSLPKSWTRKPVDPSMLPDCADCGLKIEGKVYVVGILVKRSTCSACWTRPR